VSICVLEHLNDDIQALREMRRVIKPDGILAMTVDSFSYPRIEPALQQLHRKKYHVVNYYTCMDLEKKLYRSGFQLLEHKFITRSAVAKYFYELYIQHPRLSYFLFPMAYPLSIVSDSLFGRKECGFKLAVKAQAI
jgi:ubiquinone/menaquinone biosynthesis C-methylase UbiE